MPNYDFQKDKFDICWLTGDELAALDRESVRALSTVLSAALNADQVEMPVAVIEDMLKQLHEVDIKFAKAELEEAEFCKKHGINEDTTCH